MLYKGGKTVILLHLFRVLDRTFMEKKITYVHAPEAWSEDLITFAWCIIYTRNCRLGKSLFFSS